MQNKLQSLLRLPASHARNSKKSRPYYCHRNKTLSLKDCVYSFFFDDTRPPDILRVSSDTPRRRKPSQECDQPVRSAHAGAMGRVLEEFAPGEDLGVETPWSYACWHRTGPNDSKMRPEEQRRSGTVRRIVSRALVPDLFVVAEHEENLHV